MGFSRKSFAAFLVSLFIGLGFAVSANAQDEERSGLTLGVPGAIGLRADEGRVLDISIFQKNEQGRFELVLAPRQPRFVGPSRFFNWREARVGGRYWVHAVDLEHAASPFDRTFTLGARPSVFKMPALRRPTDGEQILALRKELADLKVAKATESAALQKQIGDLRTEADMEHDGRLDKEAQIRVLQEGIAARETQIVTLGAEKMAMAKLADQREQERGAVADKFIQAQVEIDQKDASITALRRTISVFGPQDVTVIRDPVFEGPIVHPAGTYMAKLGAWYIFPGSQEGLSLNQLDFWFHLPNTLGLQNLQVWVNGEKYSSTIPFVFSGSHYFGGGFFDSATSQSGEAMYVEFFGDILANSYPGTYLAPIEFGGWGTGHGTDTGNPVYAPGPVSGQDLLVY